MKIKISSKSIKGKNKLLNQDYFVISKNQYEQILFAVADGVSTYKNSNLASEFSCKILEKEFLKINFENMKDSEILFWGKFLIKDKIKNKLNQIYHDIATTLTFIILINSFFFIFHVGNTRFYQLKNNIKKLFKITRDHDIRTNFDQTFSWIKGREFLSNSISNKNLCFVDSIKISLEPGQYILTSDGIHNFVKLEYIENIMNNSNLILEEKLQLILDQSIFNGSLDDKTIILIKIN